MAGATLDRLLGEPKRWHPLVGFGWLAGRIEGRLNVGSGSRLLGLLAWSLAVLPAVVLAGWLCTLPLGWLLAWHYHGQGQGRQRSGFVAWFPIALIVAGILQWLQKFLPRTPALSDIVFNMLGVTAGWLAGMISGSSLDRLSRRYLNLHAADRFALVMVVLWVAARRSISASNACPPT